ncbi:hypothetical protein GJ688_04225 [Heliobacillus mobilis]|uniref:Isoprenylcysteine carboxylmethyltransferase family protein n=1 Tax=Heliobacterium mobile TaxID=28064 RepID=A0A6I3SH67_HELMO|nr:hypothetical protein [Heliobacterium mobile]
MSRLPSTTSFPPTSFTLDNNWLLIHHCVSPSKIANLLVVIGILIPGFDYRYHLSIVPVWLVIFSNLIVLLGYALIFWVFKVNRYASATIRTEAEQTVILSGPYAVVRHPMYTGGLLILLFTPMALGSYWALIPFAASIPVIVLRALNEEDVLLRELPGYREYCSKTRYRLLPMVW